MYFHSESNNNEVQANNNNKMKREREAGLTYFVHDQQKIKEDNVRGAVKDPSNSSLT